MNTPSPTITIASRRGFSLIEILIAVLVLALGLLGLGAVFPAVIAQQRDAVDRVQGFSAANSAVDILRNAGEMADWNVLSEDVSFSRISKTTINDSPNLNPTLWVLSSRWETEWPVSPNLSGAACTDQSTPSTSTAHLDNYSDTGMIRFGSLDETDTCFPMQRIPVSARLIPDPLSGEDPRYVWDFVCRREPFSGRVEAAVFVRRVDGRIRDAEGSLAQTVTDPDRAFPVAVDDDGFGIVGDAPRASRNYSVPRSLDVEVPVDPGTGDFLLDRISLLDATPEDSDWAAVSRFGQRVVDNLGRVRRVVGIDEELDFTLIVEPAYTVDEAEQSPPPAGVVNRPEVTKDFKLDQIVFTSEIPVAVDVVEVQR